MHLDFTKLSVNFPPGEPTKTSLSTALGYTVPDPFVTLTQGLYEQSGRDEGTWPHLFTALTGIYLAGADARYPNTPPELFSFAQLGVDGVHYGHVIHAPELPAQDYPVGEFSPMDGDGVSLAGSDTSDAIETLVSSRLAAGVGDAERDFITDISARLGLHPAPEKERRRYDAEGNGLPIQPAIPPKWRYIPSSDGIGVLAPAETFHPDPPTALDPLAPLVMYLKKADEAYNDGFPATSLYYLREAYWQFWARSSVLPLINVRLTLMYQTLGRPTLAEIVQSRAKDETNNSQLTTRNSDP